MKLNKIIPAAALVAVTATASAQNPIIRDAFTADPSAHVFNGRVYLYPSHDIPAPADYARKDWFCMADYHVYSSDNLVDWVDHGVIVDQKSVPWVNPTGYSMWAPDCNYINGKYYFVFPAGQKPQPGRFGGNAIGLAVADSPEGPFKPEAEPIQGAGGIDPCLFVDDDGKVYLAWSGRGLMVQQMAPDMSGLIGESYNVSSVIPKGQTEGPFLFKANGKYYYTYPWVEDKRECLAYAMADNPLGPYKFVGKIMEQDPNDVHNCWTNHHSVINFKGKWYLFYHHNDYSPRFDKNRSVCIDELEFNADGTIKLVTPTQRGVGVTKAQDLIQIDRYSELMECRNVEIAYVNADRPFDGWKVVFSNSHQDKGAFWARYDRVEFGKEKMTSVQARIHSLAGGNLEVRVDAPDGQLVSTIKVGGAEGWQDVKAAVKDYPTGQHNLYVIMTSGSRIDVDWVTFK